MQAELSDLAGPDKSKVQIPSRELRLPKGPEEASVAQDRIQYYLDQYFCQTASPPRDPNSGRTKTAGRWQTALPAMVGEVVSFPYSKYLVIKVIRGSLSLLEFIWTSKFGT